MDEFVFAGLVMIAVTLLAMGVMDVLAVIITTLRVARRLCPSPRGLSGKNLAWRDDR
jgi:hypothetical protein